MPTYKIVGAHFRPPAKAILQCLAGDTELILRPEPGNQYDANAVQVIVRSELIPESEREELDLRATGYGFSLKEIMQETEWHLGYVPRTDAVDLAPRLKGVEVLGRLTFDAKGNPVVEVDLDEKK